MSNEQYEAALRKARACLRLSESSNPHEAALAAARAQEIMDKYRLSTADVSEGLDEAAEAIKDFGEEPLDSNKERHARWCGALASSIGHLNGVLVYRSRRGYEEVLKLVGRTSDVEVVRSLYNHLRAEVLRLMRANVAGQSGKNIRAYAMGVTETVVRRLRAEQAATFAAHSNQAAVMVVKNQIVKVEAWVKETMKLKDSRQTTGTKDAEAQMFQYIGQQHGYKVQLKPTVKAKEIAS